MSRSTTDDRHRYVGSAWCGRCRLLGWCVLLLLAVIAAVPATRARAGTGQSPDYQAFLNISKAMTGLAGDLGAGRDPELASKTAQAVIGAQLMQTRAGEEYRVAALDFADAQAAAAACDQIPKSNPTLEGVFGEFLACIGPINAALIFLEKKMADLESAIVSNSSPVLARPPTRSMRPFVNDFTQYAKVTTFVSQVAGTAKSLFDLTSLGSEIRAAGAGGTTGLRVTPLSLTITHAPPAEGKSVVVTKAAQSLFETVVKNSQLPRAIQNVVDATNLPNALGLPPEFGGETVPGFPPSSMHGQLAAAHDVLVVVARSPFPYNVGFAPSWTKSFAKALLVGRAREEAQVAALLGLPAGTPPAGRMTPKLRGGIDHERAAKLSAVLRNQAARVMLLVRLVRTLKAVDRAHGSRKSVLRRAAANVAETLARLYTVEPSLRAAAVSALRPPKSAQVKTIISAPRYIDVTPTSVLTDPRRDAASRHVARTFAHLAASLRQ